MAAPQLPETGAHLPSPPFVPLKGIPNFRDLGGAPVPALGPGAHIRRNLVFRCGEPTRAPPETVAAIRALGVTHIFDLRSQPEIDKMQVAAEGSSAAPVINWPGVERVFCPVFPDKEYDPAALARRYANYQDENPTGIVEAYRAILTSGGPAYATVARHILQRDAPSPLIIHCTAGKDRTGVLAALLLSLCGVADNAVADEYHLTEAGLGAWTEDLLQALLRHEPTAQEAGVRRMLGARRESMLHTLAMLRRDFGGAEAYFESTCGLTKDEVAALKARLVADA